MPGTRPAIASPRPRGRSLSAAGDRLQEGTFDGPPTDQDCGSLALVRHRGVPLACRVVPGPSAYARGKRQASCPRLFHTKRRVPPVDPERNRRGSPSHGQRFWEAARTASSGREVGDRPDQRLRDGGGPGEDGMTGRTALSVRRVVVGIRPGHGILFGHRPAGRRYRATRRSVIEVPRVPRRSPFYPRCHGGVSRPPAFPAVGPTNIGRSPPCRAR
jgi:hypothetical protein